MQLACKLRSLAELVRLFAEPEKDEAADKRSLPQNTIGKPGRAPGASA